MSERIERGVIAMECLLDVMWHSLGMTAKNRRKALAWWLDDDNHRNHFCVTIPSPDYDEILTLLESRGWMKPGRFLNGGRDRYWHVTDDGIRAARENFPVASKSR